jgi:hypothetical protein
MEFDPYVNTSNSVQHSGFPAPKWLGNDRNTGELEIPENVTHIENLNTPMLARNAPFDHLGAPRACRS